MPREAIDVGVAGLNWSMIWPACMETNSAQAITYGLGSHTTSIQFIPSGRCGGKIDYANDKRRFVGLLHVLSHVVYLNEVGLLRCQFVGDVSEDHG